MKIMLTGITGNLGYEIALALIGRGIDLVPVIRTGRKISGFDGDVFACGVVENELLNSDSIEYDNSLDCIVHSAGSVQFNNTGNLNQLMMKKIIEFAKKKDIPVYYASTAFVYKPEGARHIFNNAYEEDKFLSEKLLRNSGLVHTIFRPSVLVGNSQSGEIKNFSGYYSLVEVFVSAVRRAIERGDRVRFPKMYGESNMLPVDQASSAIVESVLNNDRGVMYVSNPNPPSSSFVMDETLKYFDVLGHVDILDIAFEDFGKLSLSQIEIGLYNFVKHFSAYWSMDYSLPQSICKENRITKDYIIRALDYYSKNTQNV